jgi:hypothetical protein
MLPDKSRRRSTSGAREPKRALSSWEKAGGARRILRRRNNHQNRFIFFTGNLLTTGKWS